MGVWQMFAAIIIHSLAAMFCIGTELVHMMVYAVLPAGVMVSMVTAPANTSQPLVAGPCRVWPLEHCSMSHSSRLG